jgi:transcription antitermination factor NusG
MRLHSGTCSLEESNSEVASPSEFWVAVYVRSHYEQSVSLILRNKGFNEFLPTTSETSSHGPGRPARLKPLFPGYLFCRFARDCAGGRIVTTPGVLRILGTGCAPSPVPDTEIANLRMLVNSGMDFRPLTAFTVGQHVQVVRGPLAGITGTLLRVKGDNKLVVSVTLLQRSVAVRLEPTDVIQHMFAPRKLPSVCAVNFHARA